MARRGHRSRTPFWAALAVLILCLTAGSYVDATASVVHAGPARSIVFALLADNHLLTVRLDTGAVVARLRLGPVPLSSSGAGQGPVPASSSGAGHYLALSSDGRTLYALAPGDPASLSVVDVATVRARARYQLPHGLLASGLAVGPATGRLYVFSNRPERGTTPFGTPVEDVVVQALDPRHGRVVAHWTARRAAGHDWSVYQGAVAPDERHLFISYHGSDTTGIDRFTVGRGGLQRCSSPPSAHPQIGAGCLPTHGGFTLDGAAVLAATGTPLILELTQTGRIERGLNTRLTNNHLMEFVVDGRGRELYAVGPCDYAGGVSAVGLATGQTRLLVPPGAGGPCGARVALGPRAAVLVVGTTTASVLYPSIRGALLFLDTRTGTVRRTVSTPSEPADVLVVTPR